MSTDDMRMRNRKDGRAGSMPAERSLPWNMSPLGGRTVPFLATLFAFSSTEGIAPFRSMPYAWYHINMSQHDVFTGFPIEVSDGQTRRWGAILVKAVFVILVVGVVLSAILWAAISSDMGALILSATFAACAGLMIIRQALLAERG